MRTCICISIMRYVAVLSVICAFHWTATTTCFLAPACRRKGSFIRIYRSHPALFVPTVSSSLSSQVRPKTTPEILVRDPTYGEMVSVANVIVSCFQANNSATPTKQLYQAKALNEAYLQKNFPHNGELHRMFIALVTATCTTDDDEEPTSEGSHPHQEMMNQVVGFCDVDARPPNQLMAQRYNPRPYISDLCVTPDFRRLGIGQMLVKRCEQFCQESGFEKVYVRVNSTNEAASRMYKKLGYQDHSHPLETSEETFLMQKPLSVLGDRA